MKLNPFSKAKKVENKPQEKPEVVESTVSTAPISSGRSSKTTILKQVYISEKASQQISYNQYVFKVDGKANRSEIAKEVAARYNVKVDRVRVINVPGKRRDFGRHPGFRPGFRKAIVELKEGFSIGEARP